MITHPPLTRASARGLGYGSVRLVAVCLAFGLVDMVTLTTTLSGTVLALGGVILVGGALLVHAAQCLLHGHHLADRRGRPDARDTAHTGSGATALTRHTTCLCGHVYRYETPTRVGEKDNVWW